jgi:hypothetical protein
MDLKCGTWNVRSFYMAASLMAVLEELSKYKLDFVGVQEVRWEGGGTDSAGDYTILWKGNEIRELHTGFLCIRESYQQLSGSSLLVIEYCT